LASNIDIISNDSPPEQPAVKAKSNPAPQKKQCSSKDDQSSGGSKQLKLFDED
jgi:hypothetical protein